MSIDRRQFIAAAGSAAALASCPPLARAQSGPIRLGLLTRRPDPEDRRAFRLELTESGAQRLAEVTRERRAAWRERLAQWPDGDVAALADGLARLARDLPG